MSYASPRIVNLTVNRCTEDGTLNSDGTYFWVSFDWSSDLPVNEITIMYRKTTEAGWLSTTPTYSYYVDSNGNPLTRNGSVTDILGGGALSTENAYYVAVAVADEEVNRYSALTALIPKSVFPIDFYKNLGVTIGGAAKEEGFHVKMEAFIDALSYINALATFNAQAIFENSAIFKGWSQFEWDSVFYGKTNLWGEIYGQLYTLGKAEEIPANANLNSYQYRVPGVYGCYSNAAASTLTNLPSNMAGRLIVSASTGNDPSAASWVYLRQTYIELNGDNIYMRHISSDGSGNWTYGAWRGTSYIVGETISLPSYITGGQLTSAQKDVMFTIILPKPVSPTVKGVRFTDLLMDIRKVSGGYIGAAESSGLAQYAGNSNYTIGVEAIKDNVLTIRLTNKPSTYNATNNTPVTVHLIRSTFTLT